MLNASPRYKWIVLAITTVGVLMVAIDTTVVILALPSIILELHSNLINMVWVIMSYIFVTAVLLRSHLIAEEHPVGAPDW